MAAASTLARGIKVLPRAPAPTMPSPSSTLTAPATRTHQARVVVYRQTSPELGPVEALAPGAAAAPWERDAIPNPSC